LPIIKVLVLEDDPKRVKKLQQIFIGTNIQMIHYSSVKKAIDYCKKNYDKLSLEKKPLIDFMMLDHDLDGRVYVPSEEENTGFQFALYIAKETKYDASKILIHSRNALGAANMESVLPDALIFPFTEITKDALIKFLTKKE